MPTFTPDNAAEATIVLIGKLLEALNKTGALPDDDASDAVKAAVHLLQQTKRQESAAVLEHYLGAWVKR